MKLIFADASTLRGNIWFTPLAPCLLYTSKPETESKPTEFSRTKASLYTKDRKNPFANNPYIQKGMGSASPAGAPDYQVGDRVSHTKFGQGIVRSLTKLTNDYEVVIEFDGFGQRKLRSSFAKLTKL